MKNEQQVHSILSRAAFALGNVLAFFHLLLFYFDQLEQIENGLFYIQLIFIANEFFIKWERHDFLIKNN